MGGTMRLGADPVKLHDGSLVRALYGESVVYERHRHRYEVNNHLRRKMEAVGLVCSGTSPDERLVEVIELERGFAPVLRRLAIPPRVQVAPGTSGAAVPRVRRCRPRPRRERRQPIAARGAARRTRVPPRREAGDRRRARTAARHFRLALPDREPVGSRAARAPTGWRRSSRRLGVPADEDDAGPSAGADAGNLLARIAGRSADTIMLCAHLDTVPPTAPIEPELVDGGWRNANAGILGADNKAAVAVMLELARRLTSGEQPPGGRPRAAVHGLRGERPARGQGLRRLQADQPVRVRLRPRLADRRDRARLADLPEDHRRPSRTRRACRAAPGGRPQCHRGGGPGHRRDAARASRCGTPPPTSARSPGEPRRTSWLSAAASRARSADWATSGSSRC